MDHDTTMASHEEVKERVDGRYGADPDTQQALALLAMVHEQHATAASTPLPLRSHDIDDLLMYVRAHEKDIVQAVHRQVREEQALRKCEAVKSAGRVPPSLSYSASVQLPASVAGAFDHKVQALRKETGGKMFDIVLEARKAAAKAADTALADLFSKMAKSIDRAAEELDRFSHALALGPADREKATNVDVHLRDAAMLVLRRMFQHAHMTACAVRERNAERTQLRQKRMDEKKAQAIVDKEETVADLVRREVSKALGKSGRRARRPAGTRHPQQRRASVRARSRRPTQRQSPPTAPRARGRSRLRNNMRTSRSRSSSRSRGRSHARSLPRPRRHPRVQSSDDRVDAHPTTVSNQRVFDRKNGHNKRARHDPGEDGKSNTDQQQQQ